MSVGEFELIYRYFSALGHGPGVDLSVGDDCALLRLEPGERLAVSVDTVVEGVHFPEDMFPEDLGFRAVAVAASDLAAMGARPLAMTVALTLPDSDQLWLHSFSQGVAQAVSEFSLPLVGGDTTRGPLAICVQVMGALPLDSALLRSGASPGDALCVSGTLGDGAAALAVLQGDFTPPEGFEEALLECYLRPRARLALGRELLGVASACIDISDGLLADAGHIAAASGVGLRIQPELLPLSPALAGHAERERVLRWALSGGDDYELCFTLPPGSALPAGCTRIGEVVAGEGVDAGIDLEGSGGFEHF
ncbi:thiamine-phosphate kinase [Mangrovimicrobium sediminis]|uniref:thiamine-phosphate kinase n=1 Tax=Mangrovimicrobium sediminis TaxID=2562682 RepID=UPI0019803FFF|nr:thiamine-phosphate kinase [Haliea sp. SAOS-164]